MVQPKNSLKSLHQHHGSEVAPVSVLGRLSTPISNHHSKRHTKRGQMWFDISIWIRFHHRILSSPDSKAICPRTTAARPARNSAVKLDSKYAQKVCLHPINTPLWSQTECDRSVGVGVDVCVLCFDTGNRRESKGICVVLRFI